MPLKLISSFPVSENEQQKHQFYAGVHQPVRRPRDGEVFVSGGALNISYQ